MAFRGALIRKSSDQAIYHYAPTIVQFGTVDYDPEHFFDGQDAFAIPQGVSKVRLLANCIWQANSVGTRQAVIKKNGNFFPGDPCTNVLAVPNTTTDFPCISPVLCVQYNDYFQLEVAQFSGGMLNLLSSTGTYFAIEIIE